jgi:hypothetical protein
MRGMEDMMGGTLEELATMLVVTVRFFSESIRLHMYM